MSDRGGEKRRVAGHVVWLVLASALFACDRSSESERRAKAAQEEARRKEAVLTKWRAPVSARIARVHELVDASAATPPAPDDAVAPKTDPPMKMRELHLDDPTTNADVMMQSELASLQRGILGTCATYLRGIPDEVEASVIEDVFPGCARMRFFLVVRPSTKVKPELLPNGDEYRGGRIVGDVVVFDLDPQAAPKASAFGMTAPKASASGMTAPKASASGMTAPKALGAFPIDVELSRTVEVRIDATKNEMQYELDEALREEVLKAVEKKIGER